MAFGFIKKVFSFGRKEVVEEKAGETAPTPGPDALKPAGEPAPPSPAPAEPTPELPPAPVPEIPPAPEPETPPLPEEPAIPEPAAPPPAPPEIPAEPAPPQPEPRPQPEIPPAPAPEKPEIPPQPAPEVPPQPAEIPPAPVPEQPAPGPAEVPPAPTEPEEPEPRESEPEAPPPPAPPGGGSDGEAGRGGVLAEARDPDPEPSTAEATPSGPAGHLPLGGGEKPGPAEPSPEQAPTPARPSPRLRGEGKGEGQRQPPQDILPADFAPAPPAVSIEPASDGAAPHPLPDLLPASGEKEAVAAPPPFPDARESGKVTVTKKVEQKAEPQPAAVPEPKKSWFQRMRDGLSRSSRELTGNIAGIFTKRKLDDDTLQDLEDVLIRADLGVETALRVTDSLASSRYGKDVSDAEVRAVMAAEVEKVLAPVARPLELDLAHKPHVVLVVGVNGTGKTTTIGKLAAKLTAGGLSVMLAAGDTFRAAAIEQLKIWGERTSSPVIATKLGADAAGLAYDAFEKAKEAGSDVLIIDTAGRLQNKAELMAELEKIVRVLGKLDPEAPHTVLQTVDATTGQNALNQVEIFRNVAGVNGLVMTKLDGTARGGILVAIAAKHRLPVYFIGVGEQVDDLEPFSASDFAKAIAGVN